MLYTRRQISKIIGVHRVRLFPVTQCPIALQNEIDLFFTIVECALAAAVCIERRLPETGHSSQNSIVCVTFTEDWLVVASPKCKRPGVLAYTRNVPMQPGGIDFPVLSQQIRRDQQKQQQTSQLDPVMCGARARPFAKSVYHRICLTQIEIFRFIGIHFASDGGCELRIQACAPASTMAPGKGAITAPHLPLPDHVRRFALVFLLGLLSLKLSFAQEGNQSSPKN